MPGLISRGTEGDRVAVKVGVIQMGGRMIKWVRIGVFEEMTF